MSLKLKHLRNILHYNQQTGVFTWLVSHKRIQKGCAAGTKKNGYVRITIGGTVYPAHRLAWFYVSGEWPDKQIDHINRNRSDNRLSNLRLASVSQNNCNTKIRVTNSSGVKGVHWSKEKNKWLAQITVNKKKFQIGGFTDIELAELVMSEARDKYHGDFANMGR